MARSISSYIPEIFVIYGKKFWAWLGITSGSLSDIPGNHMNIGHIFLADGRASDALKRYKLAAWMRPKSADAQAGMAKAHAALGDHTAAQQAAGRAAQLGYSDMNGLQTALKTALQTAKTDALAKAEEAASDAPTVKADVAVGGDGAVRAAEDAPSAKDA